MYECESWVRDRVIERSASDYSSAPVLVKKPDGTYRMCIEYRDLIKKTVKDAYSISSMVAILDKLRRAKYTSKVDLKSAYLQIRMQKCAIQHFQCRGWACGILIA